MYKSTAKSSITGLVGWRAHHDATEIPAFTNTTLGDTETGDYYQQENPALRLDYIKALLPANRDLEGYLAEVEEDAATSLLDAVIENKKMQNVGKELAQNLVVRNSIGYTGLTMNQSRFVGVQFHLRQSISLQAVIKRFGLWTSMAQTGLTMYLYHEHSSAPVATYTFNSATGKDMSWSSEVDIEMDYSSSGLAGGSWFFGYYQDDLTGQARRYNKLNWRTGYCSTCDGGTNNKVYKQLSKYVDMRAFYVPSAALDVGRDLFDLNNVQYEDTETWGLNFNIAVRCDFTQFWIDNRRTFKTALKKAVSVRVMEDMVYSSQFNRVEQSAQIRLQEDLPTKREELKEAIKNINLDHGNLDTVCNQCAHKPRTRIGVV